jgi:uncharacterized hydrophobic protein (TIGR00271 family)
VGLSVSVGLGVFGVLTNSFQTISVPDALTTPYLLLAIVAIPIVLTLAERGAVVAGTGGVYSLVRHSGWLWQSYFTGWLLLGGHLVLSSLLGFSAALHLNLLFQQLFALSLDLSLLATIIIGVTTLNMLLETSWTWSTRSKIIFTGVVFLGVLFLLKASNIWTETGVWPLGQGTHNILELAAKSAASLWGLFLILAVRNEVHRPTYTIVRAMLLTVAIGSGLGVLLSWVLFTPGVAAATIYAMLSRPDSVPFSLGSLVLILFSLFGLLTSLIALHQSKVSNLQLLGSMTRDAVFPTTIQRNSQRYKTPILSLIPSALVSIALVNLVSANILAALAALSLFWVVALVHISDAVRSKPNLPEKRFPKLPFHPLFPWLVIAIGLLFPIQLPLVSLVMGVGWLVIGAAYFAAYAGQRVRTMLRQEVVVGYDEETSREEIHVHTVMVGISDPKNAVSLIQFAGRVAQARGGQLLVLKIVALAEHIPANVRQQTAQEEWERVSELVNEANLTQIQIKPLVRLAPSPTVGILETVREEEVDLLLLGWEDEVSPEASQRLPKLDRIIGYARCEVAVIRGKIPTSITQILVSTAGGPHAPAALALGQDLIHASHEEARIRLIYLLPDHAGQTRQDATAQLQATLSAVQNEDGIESVVIEARTIQGGILTQSQQADLLLLGASQEEVLKRSFLGTLPTEIITTATTPTIIAKARETRRLPWWLYLWSLLIDIFPNLSVSRQTEVYGSMQAAALPTIDFFVLITLAATIAMLGLLQNSAAVIIGAMLVAPLMSPILAMGMAIVQGDLRLLATAAESTTKGIVLAIVVGTIFTFISPLNAATSEIMARTSPNLLDLMVALASGAAAGYAISRKEVAAALPGVAIAAALVPPLCVVGYGIGTAQLLLAGGALLLFSTNLVAIIFAAAIIFLLLGFHPTRAERGELLRGLKITLFSLGVVTVILAVMTYFTVTSLNRRLRVEQVFNNEIIKLSAEVIETTITRTRDGFLIEASSVNFDDSFVSPQQIQVLEAALREAVGQPVEVNLLSVTGSRSTLEGADQRIRLEILFKGKMVEYNAETQTIGIEGNTEEGYVITAVVISFDDAPLTRQEMLEIQESLSQTMEAPVTIRSSIISGQKINLEGISPTPTVAPTPTPTP